eukprot:c34208_g1_i1 orf=138-692(-)
MDLYFRFSILLLLAFGLNKAFAESFTVGDSQGWVVGSVNYTQWAAGKEFHVGDELLFNYLKQYHNVLVVDEAGYINCTTTNIMATYDNGKTMVTFSNPGAHYYICGVPGHCESGQKLGVVVKNSTPKSYSPSPTPSPVPGEFLTPSSAEGHAPNSKLQSDSRPANHLSNGTVLLSVFIVMLSLL